jgi:uncharacterized protein YegP (UPF0339 family)
MLKSSAKLAAVFLLSAMAACAADEADDDSGLDPACDDDTTKCDGQSAQGFEVFKGIDGSYYFHLVSGNGKIVMRSQAYSSKQAATKGTESVRTNGVKAAQYKVLEAANGEFYINLYAANHEIIATSETYPRKFNAERALDASVTLVAKAQHIRAASSGAKFQTFVGADHQAYFHLRGKNGEVMLSSEGYLNTASAIKAIASIRENGKIASRFSIKSAADGQYFFTLEAANHEIIARGETYASKSNAQRAVDTVVELLTSELVADPKPVKAPTRSIESHSDLLQALQGLADAAAGGTSLVYFGAAEQAAKASGSTCETMAAADIASQYDALVDEVMTEGKKSLAPQLTQALLTSARSQLVELLGSDTYQLCTHELAQGAVTQGSETFILSTRADGPKLVLQLGFQAD